MVKRCNYLFSFLLENEFNERENRISYFGLIIELNFKCPKV